MIHEIVYFVGLMCCLALIIGAAGSLLGLAVLGVLALRACFGWRL